MNHNTEVRTAMFEEGQVGFKLGSGKSTKVYISKQAKLMYFKDAEYVELLHNNGRFALKKGNKDNGYKISCRTLGAIEYLRDLPFASTGGILEAHNIKLPRRKLLEHTVTDVQGETVIELSALGSFISQLPVEWIIFEKGTGNKKIKKNVNKKAKKPNKSINKEVKKDVPEVTYFPDIDILFPEIEKESKIPSVDDFGFKKSKPVNIKDAIKLESNGCFYIPKPVLTKFFKCGNVDVQLGYAKGTLGLKLLKKGDVLGNKIVIQKKGQGTLFARTIIKKNKLPTGHYKVIQHPEGNNILFLKIIKN